MPHTHQSNPRTKAMRKYTPYHGTAANNKKRMKRDHDLMIKNARAIAKLSRRTLQRTSYQAISSNILLYPPSGTVQVDDKIFNLASFVDWDPLFGSNAQISSFQPRATIKEYQVNLNLSIQLPDKALPKQQVQIFLFRLKKETARQLLEDTTNLTIWDGQTNGEYYQSTVNDAQNQGPITLNPKYFTVVQEKRVTMVNTVRKLVVPGDSDTPTMFDNIRGQFEQVYMTVKCNDQIYNPSGSADPQATQHWKQLPSDKVEHSDRLYMMFYTSGYNSLINVPGGTVGNAVTVNASVIAVAETIAS